MPPREVCPNCLVLIQDWHIEWYRPPDAASLYKGLAAWDCPLCKQAAGYDGGVVGPAPIGAPLVRRDVDKAALWAADQAIAAGGTLEGYVGTEGSGIQYADYWTLQEIKVADQNEINRRQGP